MTSFFGLPRGGNPGRVGILGVPFDCGTHPWRIGARHGPEAVRTASGLIQRHHPSLGDRDVASLLGAIDCGDVAGITSGRLAAAHPLIEAAAADILAAGAIPIGVGGDGSMRVTCAERARVSQDAPLLVGDQSLVNRVSVA